MAGNYRNNPRRAIYAKSPPKGPQVPPRPPSRPQKSSTPATGRPTVPPGVHPAAETSQARTSRPVQPQSERPNRPAVRPAAPPQRVMPHKPTPAPAQAPIQPKLGQPVRPMQAQRPVMVKNIPAARPAAPPLTVLALNTAAAHADISSDASFLSSTLERLQEGSSFSDIHSEVLNLDATLNNLTQLLESARSKKYVFQPNLENDVYQAAGRWDTIRQTVISTAEQQSAAFQSRLPSLSPQVQRLNSVLANPAAASPLLRTTRTQVDNLSGELDRIKSSLRSQYSPIDTQARSLITLLTNIHWGLDQLCDARFSLETGEDLVMAVPTRWDKEGKDDPEGALFLTNKRLIFERKEKVATKKVLFITTASELVHEVLISQPLSTITSSKAEGKGLFGHQDFLFIQFSDTRLGMQTFHLRGQDSKMWRELVEQARTGRLERTSGAKVTAADMNRPISQSDILVIQQEINQLQDEMMLKPARQELAALQNEVSVLNRRLADLRGRGYAIEKDLEASLTILTSQWDRIKGMADTAIEQQTRLLGEQMISIQQKCSQLVGMGQGADTQARRTLYLETKSSMAAASAQAEAASSTVAVLYEKYWTDIELVSAHMAWVDWMLDALATASFQLSASEYGIAATEAVWQAPGLEPENGVLYLSNLRLIWEDRVDTYELKVNIPLQFITDVQQETLPGDPDTGPQDVLFFNFAGGAPLANARFTLSLPVAGDWLKMVGRARAGGYNQDLAIKLDPEEVERIRKAPTSCASCNAAFTAPILRGQTELKCEYCGSITRF